MINFGNLLLDLPQTLDQERFQTLFQFSNVRVERIVSRGHASPEGFWYQQVDAEWVLVVQGRATLRFEDGLLHEMVPGSHALIPAGMRHRVEWTDPEHPTIWLAVHFPPPPASP
jgi:cupin 2 domain-containing protein